MQTQEVQTGMADQSVLKALVVEDNRITQMVIEHMLKRHGLRMDLASDGREAVRLASQGAYVLVIMDVHLPVLDGLSALEQIRAVETANRRARVPAMVISANPVADNVKRAQRAGADVFLPKPLAVDLFDAAITSLTAS